MKKENVLFEKCCESNAHCNCAEAKEEVNYGYYSKLLSTPFDTLDELRAAEKEYQDKLNAKAAAQSEKKALAENVEKAYANYVLTLEESQKEFNKLTDKIAQAKSEYVDAKNQFIEKFGSFHMTYVNKEPKVDVSDATTVKVNNIFDSIVGSIFSK